MSGMRGKSESPAMTIATFRARASATTSVLAKLSCRSSIAWRMVTTVAHLRQSGEKSFQKRGVIFPRRWELPQNGPELVPQRAYAAREESLDRNSRIVQAAACDAVAWRLDAEDKVVGRCVAPFREGLQGLGAIESSIDFDGGQMAARVIQLLGVRQIFGVENPAPGREAPAAHPDIDAAFRHDAFPDRSRR